MKYISVVDTAKLIRAALKESFAGVKFSVKSSSYAGGASINISYVDGPTSKQVEDVISVFEGSYFDGMQDYKGQNYANLDGEEVKFGADFVFVRRNLSVPVLSYCARKVCNYYGIDINQITIKDSIYSGAFIDCDNKLMAGGRYFAQAVGLESQDFSMCDTAVSKTAGRVYSMGDDGYGYGCVGKLAA
jgi:hypothetical protein